MTLESLTSEALGLAESERIALLRRIVASLPDNDKEQNLANSLEIADRRDREIEEGISMAMSHDDFLRAVRSATGR